jgi:hypothetical protein
LEPRLSREAAALDLGATQALVARRGRATMNRKLVPNLVPT